MPITVFDVAAAAGVSHQTVSRVVNDHPSVRPETRQRVREVIDALGYRPNLAARTLAGRRSGVMGVVALESTQVGPSSTLYAIERAARAAGFTITVTLAGSALPDAIERLTRQGVEGIVIIAPLVGQVDRLPVGVPMVVVEGPLGGGSTVVTVDQQAGAVAATEHLIRQGARSIWHVAGPDDWYEARARVEGWSRASETHRGGLVRGDWSAESGYACGAGLARRPDVDAIFAANDQMALGVLRALHDAGRRVPADVRVAGFDDVPEAAYFHPPLTTVRQDFAAVGRHAIERLVAELRDPTLTPTAITVPSTLVVRASTA